MALEQHNHVEHNKPKIQPKHNENKGVFLCKYCSESFSTSEAVKVHESGAHQILKRLEIEVPPPSKKVRINHQNEVITCYYCHICGTEYTLKFNLMVCSS